MKKKLLSSIMIVAVLCTMYVPVSASDYGLTREMAGNYVDTVWGVLDRHVSDDGSTMIEGVELIDLDGDGVPELFINIGMVEYMMSDMLTGKSELWRWDGSNAVLIEEFSYYDYMPNRTIFLQVGDEVYVDDMSATYSSSVGSQRHHLMTLEGGELVAYKNVSFTSDPMNLANYPMTGNADDPFAQLWVGDGFFNYSEQSYDGTGEYLDIANLHSETWAELQAMETELSKYGLEYESTDNYIRENADNVLFDNDTTDSVMHILEAAARMQEPVGTEALPTTSAVYIDGVKTEFEAYNIGGNNFFKLRDIAYCLHETAKTFSVDWNASANAIDIETRALYSAVGGEMSTGTGVTKEATPTTSVVYIDGEQVSLTAYNIGGNNFFKLRDLGESLDFGVVWDADAQAVLIDTSTGYTPE